MSSEPVGKGLAFSMGRSQGWERRRPGGDSGGLPILGRSCLGRPGAEDAVGLAGGRESTQHRELESREEESGGKWDQGAGQGAPRPALTGAGG